MFKNTLSFLLFWALVSGAIYGFRHLTQREKWAASKVIFFGAATAFVASSWLAAFVYAF